MEGDCQYQVEDDSSHAAAEGEAESHLVQGWMLFYDGKSAEALEKFQEALWAQPESSSARHGIQEALQADQPFYRVLRWLCFWFCHLPFRLRILIVLGMILLPGWLRPVVQAHPVLADGFEVLWYAVLVFVAISAVLGEHIWNLALLFNRYGRQTVSSNQVYVLFLLGATLLPGLAALFWSAHTGELLWKCTAIVFLSLTGAVVMSVHTTPGWKRKLSTTYTVLIAVTGLSGIALLCLADQAADKQLFELMGWLNLGVFLLLFAMLMVFTKGLLFIRLIIGR